jgi:hypothetical protein
MVNLRKIGRIAGFLSLILAAVPGRSQELLINELAASISNSSVDDYGEYEDWFEIYNPGKRDIDIGGWFVTDNLNKAKKWRIPSDNPRLTTVYAGSYLVFWPDKDTLQGPNHIGFALSRKGEMLGLFKPSGDTVILIDSVSYPKLVADHSFGRCTERGNSWIFMKHPTPGLRNYCPPEKKSPTIRFPGPCPPDYRDDYENQVVKGTNTTNVIKINEVICNNYKSYADENGEYDDWVELYNSGSSPVNIAGWYVSDTIVASTFHRIPTYDPNKTVIPAGGYLVLWADGQPVQGPAHLPFKFDKDGEEFYLARMVNGQLEMVDQITFPKAKNDVPYGRFPNGTGSWMRLSDATPMAANRTPRVFSGFVLNELMAVAGPGVVDEMGEEEDWIELYNPTSSPIDIGGLYLTDSTADLMLSRIPTHVPDSTTIAPGGYLLLFADNDTWQGCRHLNFKLPATGEKLILTQPDGTTEITQVTYPYMSGDATYGRYPNGTGSFVFTPPTPRQANTYQFTPVSGIYINEIMADNLDTYPDNMGEFEDWIEFYNSNDFPVKMGGLYISDSLNYPLNFRISDQYPDSTTIPAKGFLTFWADNDPEQGVLHLNIKLSGTGESLTLSQYRSETVILDSHTFAAQFENVAIGRFPDGTSSWNVMAVPTPNAPNQKLNIVRTTGVYINEFMSRSTKTYPDENGAFTDWIEIYNNNDFDVNLGGKYLTNLLSQPGMSLLPSNQPAKTTVPAKGYLMLRADANTALGPSHLNFTLRGSGDQLGLFENIGGIYYLIDSLTFGMQSDDVSYGRTTDGASEWKFFQIPSPNSPNGQDPAVISGLYINELMARNTRTITDDGGRYEDWIELYNSTNQTIDIGGLYLSDSRTEPLKHQIPTSAPDKTKIPAKGYLLLWPDLMRTQGPLHLNFELAGAGEFVSLVQVHNGQNRIIDSIYYPIQISDVSYGRLGDAAPWWVWFRTSTPKAANSTQSVDNNELNKNGLQVYPNPATTELTIQLDQELTGELEIFFINLAGVTVRTYYRILDPGFGNSMILNDIGSLAPGCYFIRVRNSEQVLTTKILKTE